MSLKKLSLTLFTLGVAAYANANDAAIEEARTNAMKLGASLQYELQTAMQANGPIAAINVCNTQAEPIADNISASTGWIVARTSLKSRNPANRPDLWESSQLQEFEQRLANGEQAMQIESFSETVEGDYTVQRYMKAIPTREGCLACHGTDINPTVASKLDELYPSDQARGFEVGQLRGAFTLQRTIKK